MKTTLAFLVVAALSLGGLAQTAEELISQADTLFQEVWTTEYTLEAHDVLQAKLEQAISLYEQALEQDEGNVQLLAMLSRCYYMLADIFVPQDEKKRTHVIGQEYGERALRATPGFVDLEKSDGFVAAVRACESVEALYWTYGNWARKVELGGAMGLVAAAMRGDDKKLRAMVERCAELDPDYLAGGPSRALGAYWAKHPFHKDFDKARELFQQAMASFPDYLENTYFYVRYYLIPNDKWEEAAQKLEEILAAPLGDYPLENAVVKLRAQQLLDEEVRPHL